MSAHSSQTNRCGSFSALKINNYRIYFVGQLTSLVGTWMQSMVEIWLVWRLTGSDLRVGTIQFCSVGSAFLMGPVVGVIVDRADRRKLLIKVELVGALQAVVVALLIFTGWLQIWHLVCLAVVLGAVTAFEVNIRYSFAHDLVDPEHLSSAVALNSVLNNASRIIGPSVAGLLMTVMGDGNEGWCFLINAASFFAVIASVLAIEGKVFSPKEAIACRGPKIFDQFMEGIRQLGDAPEIKNLLLFTLLIAFVASPYTVLFPVIASHLLEGGAQIVGWLLAAIGVGAIGGALFVGRNVQPTEKVWNKLCSHFGLVGCAYGGLAWSKNLYISLACAVALGFFQLGSFTLINTTIQRLSPGAIRGRLTSLYTMAFMGAIPIGALVKGWWTDYFGVRNAAATTGAVCIASAVAIALKRKVAFNQREILIKA